VSDIFDDGNKLNSEILASIPSEMIPALNDLGANATAAGLDLTNDAALKDIMNNSANVSKMQAALGGGGSNGSGFNTGDAALDKALAKAKKDVESKYGVSSVDVEDGGGAFGGGGGGGSGGNPFADFFKDKDSNQSGSVSGLNRQLASGESIGVQGDDLFGMVRRRYETKSRTGSFLTTPSVNRRSVH
jgi:hypothetical protein